MKPIRNFEGSIGVHAFFIRKLRGEGGGYQDKIFFFVFIICCSPGYPRAKMGSLVSQLQTVAEIWLDEDGTFSHDFDLLYRKISNLYVTK